MKVLVTGGAGFIGSNLCDALVDAGQDVVCFDNLGSGRRQNIAHLLEDPQFEFVEGDVRNISTLYGADQVYHLASRASPTDFESHPLDIAMTNTVGTEAVLSLAAETDARVLLASTSEVYGDPLEHPQSETYNGNVNLRGKRAPYDEAKRFAETLATIYTRDYGVDTRTVRLFNTYGPRIQPDDGRVISNFVTQALQGQELTVYGDGSQTRSFLYISDQIRGLRTFMNTPDLAGEVINIGSTSEISIKELAELVSSLVESAAGISYQPLPHSGDPQQRQPDISRANNLLDWEPTVDIETGLQNVISYFREEETLDA